jgi:hypothetical protein
MFNITCVNSLGKLVLHCGAMTIDDVLEELTSKLEVLQEQPNLKIEIVFEPDENEKGE